jgi:hypothetical protein
MALRPDVRPRILERTRRYLHSGLHILEDWMREHNFEWLPPHAGAICFAKYDAPINSSVLAERLRADKSVLIVPGDHFGIDGYIRFGFGLPESALRTALGRVADAFDEISAAREQAVG